LTAKHKVMWRFDSPKQLITDWTSAESTTIMADVGIYTLQMLRKIGSQGK